MDELKSSEISKLIDSLRLEATFQADRFGRRILAGELTEAADTLEKLNYQSAQGNKPLILEELRQMDVNLAYEESENFIQNKFGYCFYTFDGRPFLYNLYVHPQYRRQGHSRKLLMLAISEIRKSGYEGKIYIQANPKENSIELSDLVSYYESIGLIVCNANKPEQEGQK